MCNSDRVCHETPKDKKSYDKKHAFNRVYGEGSLEDHDGLSNEDHYGTRMQMRIRCANTESHHALLLTCRDC